MEINQRSKILNQKIILRIEKLTKSFNGLRAVDSLSLKIKRETINAIIGPNGSGKTTLLNIINGFLKPDNGDVIYNGREITSLTPQKVAQLGIGRTFQTIRIFPQITVLENMLLALEDNNKEKLIYSINPFVKYNPKELEQKAYDLLSSIELTSKANMQAYELSHGQRKLLEIIRAVALDSDLYLFDEPTAGVFPESRERIIEIFHSLKKYGKTIVFVEHNMETVEKCAERVVVLDRGKIIADGKPKAILKSKPVIRVYFGDTVNA